MYAVDDLSDAIDVTRAFLTPVEVGTWLRLVLVVFFVSGAGLGGGTPPAGDVGTFADEPATPVEAPVDEPVPVAEVVTEDLLVVLVALAVAGVLLWLLFSGLKAIMDFVFVESLRSSEVHVRRYGKANLGRALRLFLFRVLVSIIAFGPLIVGFFVVVLGADTLEGVAVASLALLALLAIPIYLLYAIVMRFTTVFVVPIMLLEERTVLGAWRRFWPTFAGNWTEYVVYLVLVWIIWILLSIALGILAFFGLLLIGIPFGIVAVIFALFGPIGYVLAAVVLLVAFALFLVYVTALQVPVYSYLRYYALLLLGDTNPDMDLIPDQRAAVRGGGGEWDDGGGGEWDDGGALPDDGGDDRDDGPNRRSGAPDDEWTGEGWNEEADDWDASSDRGDDDRDRGW